MSYNNTSDLYTSLSPLHKNDSYRTTDYQQQQKNQKQSKLIKDNQMISIIMDTIEEKSNNPNGLKRSLNAFDKQFQTVYFRSLQKENNLILTKQTFAEKNYNCFLHGNEVNYCKPTVPQNNKFIKKMAQQKSCQKLGIPKPNTLTDQFLKLTLGCEQDLIQEYDRTVNPKKYEQNLKQQMVIDIKQMFKLPQQSGYIKVPQNNQKEVKHQKSKAFFDQQYYTYLKTNMKYLQKLSQNSNQLLQHNKKSPNLTDAFNSKIKNQCSFVDVTNNVAQKKHRKKQQPPLDHNFSHQVQNFSQQSIPLHHLIEQAIHIQKRQSAHAYAPSIPTLLTPSPTVITLKLQQTGGLQNTIQKMQESLQNNELRHLRMNQFLSNNKNKSSKAIRSVVRPFETEYKSNKLKQKQKRRVGPLDEQIQIQIVKSSSKLDTGIFHSIKRRNNLIDQVNIFSTKQDNIAQANQVKVKNNLNWRQKSQQLRHKLQRTLQKN